MGVRVVRTSAHGQAAIACVDVVGDVAGLLSGLGVKGVGVGRVVLRQVPVGAGLSDGAVIGRWTDSHATVMLHGGGAVVEGFVSCCVDTGAQLGVGESEPGFPEAVDEVERRMLTALSRAASPAAIDLLLDQPRRWRWSAHRPGERDRVLMRLIEPALVVAVGPPNIGKSSLLNALAGRGVSLVADLPGTTRDHVGTLIDLGGVVVRWVDTPGVEEEIQSSKFKVQIEGMQAETVLREAQGIALRVAAEADVVVVCRDAGALIEPPATRVRVVRVGLRADLGNSDGVDCSVSVQRGEGLEEVVSLVREAVVPRVYLDDPAPWRFWA